MNVTLKLVAEAGAEPEERALNLSRLPVHGEYIRCGEDWYEVKRVVHDGDGQGTFGEVFAIPIIDPTREPLRMSEWMEPAP